jgi:N-acetylglucosamine-6-phosphate deacetylase
MKICLINGVVYTADGEFKKLDLVIENGKITEMGDHYKKIDSDIQCIDASGLWVCPGFIDIHFHGAMGKDTMDREDDALNTLSMYNTRFGVTTFYPTTWAAKPGDILSAIEMVKTHMSTVEGAQVIGIHLEGPYLDQQHKGAQLASLIRNPQEIEYQKWFDTGIVKLITCAPEIEHGIDFVKKAVAHGIRISIGHTGASYEQVLQAADYGASQATHLFNGMPPLHHREPGTVGGVLSDQRIFAQIICDGVHLHPAIVNMIYKLKTRDRVILITDSIRGAGLPDGDYDQNNQRFSVRNGVARTPEGGLSGSTLTMDRAVRNMMKFTSKPLEEILPMATSVPASEMGIAGFKGTLKPGYDADLVLLNQSFSVEKTIVKGKVVYQK